VAYLFWAYFVVWLALAVYLLWLQRKIRAVAREVERLEEESGAGERAGTGGWR
jgi:CcmD family protein